MHEHDSAHYDRTAKRSMLLTPAGERALGRRIDAARIAIRHAVARLPESPAIVAAWHRDVVERRRPFTAVVDLPAAYRDEQRRSGRDRDAAPKTVEAAVRPLLARRLEQLDHVAGRLASARRAGRTAPRLAAKATGLLLGLPLHRDRVLELADACARNPANARPVRRLRAAAAARDRAIAECIEANVRMVFQIAMRYVNRGLPADDLVQEGNLGILAAIDRFDHRLGYRFATYASHIVRQRMMQAIEQQGRGVRVPARILDLCSRAKRIRQRHLQRHGSEPAPEHLARELRVTGTLLEQALTRGDAVSSLDVPVHADEHDSGTRIEIIPDDRDPDPEDLAATRQIGDRVAAALAALAPRERNILAARFGIDGRPQLTFREIGEAVGLSHERVRQIQNAALKKLATGRSAPDLRALLQACA